MNTNQPFNCPLSEYAGFIARREYWDDLSHEWMNYSTIDEKIICLAGFVKKGGNLHQLLDNYAEGRDLEYRHRIQWCIFIYLERLFTGNHFGKMNPTSDRIKRLDKEELTFLLSEELKRHVKETVAIGADWNPSNYMEISEEYRLNDDILDSIERKHWHSNPEESFSTYLYKSKLWDYSRYSLW